MLLLFLMLLKVLTSVSLNLEVPFTPSVALDEGSCLELLLSVVSLVLPIPAAHSFITQRSV